MQLKKYKLGEICNLVPGFAFKSEDFGDYIHKVIKIKDIQPPFVNTSTADGVCLEQYDIHKLSKFIVEKGDFVLAMTGATIGKIGKYINDVPSYINQRVLKFLFEDNVDKRFIYYYLSSPQFQSYIINNIDSVSAQPNISANTIGAYELLLPTLISQHQIVSVLQALDNKISLNHAINQNLEALAKQLYDYWFVQFDFPDENGRPYKSRGGKMVWNEKLKREIPEGWENKIVEDLADVFNGATPSTANEKNYGGEIVWITPKDLSDQKQKFIYRGERNISQAGYDSCSTHLLPLNTILMSSRAPIGLLAIAKAKVCTNQGFKSFVPKNTNMATYLYYYLQTHIKQIDQLGTGTTFKEVSRDDILKFPILKPNDTILDNWELQVSAINDKQFEIQKENEALIKQRDELLPLLMNGQVSVNFE